MSDKPTARGRRSAATFARGYHAAIDDVVALLQAEATKREANGGAKAAASVLVMAAAFNQLKERHP